MRPRVVARAGPDADPVHALAPQLARGRCDGDDPSAVVAAGRRFAVAGGPCTLAHGYLPLSGVDFGDVSGDVVADEDADPLGLVVELDDVDDGLDVEPLVPGVALLLVLPDGDVVPDDDEAGGVVGGGVTTVVDDEDDGGDDELDAGGVSWRCWQAPSAKSTLAATAVVIMRFICLSLLGGCDGLPRYGLARLVPRDAPISCARRSESARVCCVVRVPTHRAPIASPLRASGNNVPERVTDKRCEAARNRAFAASHETRRSKRGDGARRNKRSIAHEPSMKPLHRGVVH